MNRARSSENFDGYVAGIAFRVVDDAVRVWRPEWMRLKNRIRYLVTHDARFRLAIDDDGQTVFLVEAAVRSAGARVRTAAAEELAKNVIEVVRAGGDDLPLDQIVSALADRSGISRRVTTFEESSAVSAGPSPAAKVESADSLRRLWIEIAILPPRQRAALLMNARTPVANRSCASSARRGSSPLATPPLHCKWPNANFLHSSTSSLSATP